VTGPKKSGAHGFFPDVPEISKGFIIASEGVKKGVVLESIGLEDVAPMVAKLLGISLVNPDGESSNTISKIIAFLL